MNRSVVFVVAALLAAASSKSLTQSVSAADGLGSNLFFRRVARSLDNEDHIASSIPGYETFTNFKSYVLNTKEEAVKKIVEGKTLTFEAIQQAKEKVVDGGISIVKKVAEVGSKVVDGAGQARSRIISFLHSIGQFTVVPETSSFSSIASTASLAPTSFATAVSNLDPSPPTTAAVETN